MIDKALQIIAPHYCYGCAKIGSVLCANCKYDIVDETLSACVVCETPSAEGICSACQTTYSKAWCVGDRRGALMAAIDGLKFNHVKAAAQALAELLDSHLPVLPPDTVVVPVPTIPSHVRVRGYDHTLLIAKEFAKLRGLKLHQHLKRLNHGVQRGKSKKERLEQARTAFTCPSELNEVPAYLLVDDVVTTNATLRYAAGALVAAGAKTVWVGVVARQPQVQIKSS